MSRTDVEHGSNCRAIANDIWPRRVPRVGCSRCGKFLRDRFFFAANAAIIMFDVTAPVTLRNVRRWSNDLVRVVGEVPTVVIGNKVDQGHRLRGLKHRRLLSSDSLQESYRSSAARTAAMHIVWCLKFYKPVQVFRDIRVLIGKAVWATRHSIEWNPKYISKMNCECYDMSARINVNIDKPLLHLARKLKAQEVFKGVKHNPISCLISS